VQKQDKPRFAALMEGLAENFSASLSRPGIDIRWRALKQYSIEQVEAAAHLILRTRRFTTMPTVADFVEAIEGGHEERAQLEAVNAWRAIQRIGGYSSVRFQDPVTAAVIDRRFGGWARLCEEQLETDRKWFLRDFAEAYIRFAESGIKQIGHLAGRHEIENSARGHLAAIAAPVEIASGQRRIELRGSRLDDFQEIQQGLAS